MIFYPIILYFILLMIKLPTLIYVKIDKIYIFIGVYLPLLWESSFCIKSPITLAYTRGHFSSLVPVEPLPRGKSTTYLPLVDHDHKLLPIHFVTKSEVQHFKFQIHNSFFIQLFNFCIIDGA